MRIVEIIPQLSSGGGERFTVDLCNELAKDNDVLLVVLWPLDSTGFYVNDLSDKVKVVSLNKKAGADVLLPWRLYHEIKNFNPDVVQTHLRAITCAFFSKLMLPNRVKFFHTVHSDAKKEAGAGLGCKIRQFVFRRGMFTPVTISEESRSSFVKFYGMDAPMIFNGRNVPHDLRPTNEVCAEIERLKEGRMGRVIVNLARINEVKRQPMIARICRRLEDEGYCFTMLMIGNNSDKDLVEEINSAGCKSVKILGERTNPLEYLAASDSYCLLSSYEGMPISLIEALGVGAVPICTPVGGIVDVVDDGVNGILAKDLSEEESYVALKRFLEVPDSKLTGMKLAAMQSYAPFSMTECAQKYMELFKEISHID